jgi:hypothetical protein
MEMIIALAGRRVDPKDQNPPRFSSTPEAVELVRLRIRDKLLSLQASVLVSSAACGADLLAVAEAGKLGIRRLVILPFDRNTFRSTSVTDRPGDWGPLYDAQLDEVQAHGDLVIAPVAPTDKAYLEANLRIIDQALSLAETIQKPVGAVRVWEGKSRGEGDLTEEFGNYARKKGLRVCDVLTR